MNPESARILALVAVGDVLLGLVLAGIGVVEDVLVLSIAGTGFLLSGAGMLWWVLHTRDQPANIP